MTISNHANCKSPKSDALGELTSLMVEQYITHIAAPNKPVMDVDRAKSTWPGRLYLRYLKRHAWTRALVNHTWVLLSPIFQAVERARLSIRGEDVSLQLITLSSFTGRFGLGKTALTPADEVSTPAPGVFPRRDWQHLISPHAQYTFPETFVADISNASVMGGTNIVIAGHFAIHHDLFNRDLEYTSEELHSRMFVNVAAGSIRLGLSDPAPERMKMAACFVDACAPNYAHWLTEVLPRIALFCRNPDYVGVPLIVNENLHANIMASLDAVVAHRNPLVLLPIGRSITVSQLFVVSCAGYLPFEPRGRHAASMSHGKFSRHAFEAIRHACLSGRRPQKTPKRIYLRRNSHVRRLSNSEEIELLLVNLGFTIVDPEKLSFGAQVDLFRGAEVIIGATGAALANMIFAESRPRIGILISKQENIIYWYWQNIARATGNSVDYIFGANIDPGVSNVHGDFQVPVEHVREFVIELDQGKP